MTRKLKKPTQSEIIYDMRDHQGMSTAAIADHFNIEVFEVNSILCRVRKRKRRDAAVVTDEMAGVE